MIEPRVIVLNMANIAMYFIAFNLAIALACDDEINGLVAVAVGAVGISVCGYYGRCKVQECCADPWISPNIPNLYYELNQRVYGQHLVSDIVVKAIKGHLKNKSPKKALTLSFNGMAGTGKNLVSRIIAENIFAKGMKSEFVKLIIATHDFKHQRDIENNKRKLERWIVDKVTECPRSMFIIDEMEKMSAGLIDVLKPFLSHYQAVHGVDYRKAIFIFLGNTGAKLINEATILNKQSKKRREDITIKEMDSILSNEALKKVGGFLHASLLEHKLIDYFVPFLPLEKSHVRQCVEDDLKEKNMIAVTEEVINRVIDELEYFPGDSQWFSESGCKKVSTKVDHLIG